MSAAEYVAEILTRRGAVDPAKMPEALAAAEERGAPLVNVVVAMRLGEDAAVQRALADELGLPFIAKVDPTTIPDWVVEAVPIGFARQHRILPVGERDRTVVAAVGNPLDVAAADDLRLLLARPVEVVVATSEAIDDAINRVYERKDETALATGVEGEQDEELQDLIDMTDEAPVIRWVNNLFYSSVRERASDIHIEPLDDKVVVRYRIDGNLVTRKEAHRGFLPSIVSRVKIEAGLNIAEKRLPQDGRITKKIAGKVVDVRVSTIPNTKGERIVMRLLDKEQVKLDLNDLGFARREFDLMDQLIHRPNGIFLVTGPTGSGKTTTLYSCLNRINTEDVNILTAEDPVEYELRGIGQTQVMPKIGLTFAAALRSFLRQDPDIIMVGEIRDHETAEIAIHASLTGHLVLSTLHTNDAPTAVTRIVEMGVQPYQISSSVLAVLAQRLVRQLCRHCRVPYFPTDENLIELGLDLARLPSMLSDLRSAAVSTVMGAGAAVVLPDPNKLGAAVEGKPRPDGLVFHRAGGCEACGNLGYRGRLGIFELMLVDEPVRREILRGSDSKTIQRVARTQGMRVLREDGARQIIAGNTSVDEVLAATQEAEG